ncbi:MAG: glycosyltransferase family 4 protein [Gammaproteobacteria bacterium]
MPDSWRRSAMALGKIGNPGHVFVTDIPSPHQIELFDEISQCGLDLGVVYVRRKDPIRNWEKMRLKHTHLFLGDGESELSVANRWIENSDLTVISGYFHPIQRKWMSIREGQQKPWCLWGERPGFKHRSFLGKIFRRFQLKTLLSSHAPIWGVGEWGVEGYRKEFGNGNRNFYNVPYFSDLSPFKKLNNHRSGSPKTILFSGQFIDRKGVVELASAFSVFARENRDIKLILMGGGPLRSRLEEILSGVARQVEFTGFRRWEELPFYYGSADIVCVPSKYDGWGMFVPEAMAAGCPVITGGRVGAARDLIESGKNGWILDQVNEYTLLAALRHAVALDESSYLNMSKKAGESAMRVDVKNGVKVIIKAMEESALGYHGPLRESNDQTGSKKYMRKFRTKKHNL